MKPTEELILSTMRRAASGGSFYPVFDSSIILVKHLQWSHDMPSVGTIHENIQAQGFCGLDDETSMQINYPLRFSPAICMAWAAVGTALASPAILWALTPFSALGAILPGHPWRFDISRLRGMLSRLEKAERAARSRGTFPPLVA